ncbi:hypothetical protein EOM09_08970 [bacterium]|nr:hypothetical protein [bacterium]
MDDNIKAEEAELLTAQINISDRELFAQAIDNLGSDSSKAEAIAAQTQKVISEKADTDPKFYHKFSQRIDEIINNMRQKKLADIEALKQMKLIEDQVLNKKDDSLPEEIKEIKGADIFYRNLQEDLKEFDLDDKKYLSLVLDVFAILKQEAIVDWYRNSEVKRIIGNKLDDYIYDELVVEQNIKISPEKNREIIEKIIKLASENYQII